jgi:hypothetical protein
VFALRSRQVGARPDPHEADADLLLSTAATMGARFPFVSPVRAIRDQTGDVADRLRAGGEIERGGLATAAALAGLLRQAGTRPLVIRIGREPIGDAPAELKDALGDPDRLVDVALRPLTTATGPLCRYPNRVHASMQVAARSWWMSQPAQAYLDAQLCAEENWERLIILLKNTRGPRLAPWMYEGSAGAAR